MGKAEGDGEATASGQGAAGQSRNLLRPSRQSALSRGGTSVYSEDIALNLVAQLRLEVAQFLLQAGQRGENDGLWAQRTAGLHVVIKPEVTSWGG